jgi:hypothetical protein
LQNKHDVSVFEKEHDIFQNASYYNQNRLHLGYHYPRSHKTRKMCNETYDKFINIFGSCVDFIGKNYYCISHESFIDHNTYSDIYHNKNMYDFDFVPNTFLQNIDGDLLRTNEAVINSQKIKEYFQKTLVKCKFIFNTPIINIEKKIENGQNKTSIILNSTYGPFDICFDCTNNQLFMIKENRIFEKTISLMYKRINRLHDYDAITIMDGEFSSLYPRFIDDNIYTLTNVKYTPLFKTSTIDEILDDKYYKKINDDQLNNVKQLMESEMTKYLPSFNQEFSYVDYFISYKCKINKKNDTRECEIYDNDGLISVICGKICGIFEMENYIINVLNL